MDADLQDEPEHIPALVAELRQGGCEAVFAGRRGTYQATSRMWTSRVFKRLMGWLVGVPSDAGSFVALSWNHGRRRVGVAGDAPAHGRADRCDWPAGAIDTSSEGPAVFTGESGYSEWSRLRFGIGSVWTALALRWGRWITG